MVANEIYGLCKQEKTLILQMSRTSDGMRRLLELYRAQEPGLDAGAGESAARRARIAGTLAEVCEQVEETVLACGASR